MSNWQFMDNERLQKKIVPWEYCWCRRGRSGGRRRAARLEKRGGVGYRYCHQMTIAEVEGLAQASGLKVLDQFYADSDLNLYSVLCRN